MLSFVYIARRIVILATRAAKTRVLTLLLAAEALNFSLNNVTNRFLGHCKLDFHSKLTLLGFLFFYQGFLERFRCVMSCVLEIEIIHESISVCGQ